MLLTEAICKILGHALEDLDVAYFPREIQNDGIVHQ